MDHDDATSSPEKTADAAVTESVVSSDPAEGQTPGRIMRRRFFREKSAVCGLVFVILLILAAVTAPVFVNGKPLLIVSPDGMSSPALRDFFAPDAQEVFVEKMFNWLFLAIPAVLILWALFRRSRRAFAVLTAAALILLAIPFCVLKPHMSQIDWRKTAEADAASKYWFAAVPSAQSTPRDSRPRSPPRPSRRSFHGM